MRLRLQELSDDEFGIMHDSVLRLLSECGVLFEHSEAISLLSGADNEVDESGRVHLAPDFVESTLAQIPTDGFTLYGRDESNQVQVAVDHINFRPATGPPFILDYESGRVREATMDDARIMTLVADALDHCTLVNSVVNPKECPGALGSVRLFVNAHRYSLKPSDPTVMGAREVTAIAQIGAAIRGGEQQLRDRPLTVVDVAMISPLRCTEEQTEAFLECARQGLPVEVLTSPAMGMTSPVTLSGCVVLALAEVIAATCLLYQVAPGLGVINVARCSPVNMYTTAYNYGAPELGMASALISAVCARYHIPCDMYGLGCVASRPGIQATVEKLFSGIVFGLSQPYMITGGGPLKNSLITSPEQLVIDEEMIRFLKRIRRPIAIDEESIGVDVVKQAIKSESVLAEDHTVRYLRSGELLDCGLGQWQTKADDEFVDLLERAHEKVEQILATHTVEPYEPAVERQINRILADCEKWFDS